MRYSTPLAFSSSRLVAGQNKCFASRDELKRAIDSCFEGDDPATAETLSSYNQYRCDNLIKSTYGWPMSTWCTSEVTDFQLLFVGKRSFNEDISTWDTSKVSAKSSYVLQLASVCP